MRTLTAISLLAFFLFNLAGYRIFFNFLNERHDSRLEASIDKNRLDESQFFIIRVDLNMPYQVQQSDFERVSGEVSFGGKIYRFVKRRVVDGQMELVCIADAVKTKLKNAETRKSQHENNAANTIAKNITTDYDFQSSTMSPPVIVEPAAQNVVTNVGVPSFLWVNSAIHPPDAHPSS